MIKSRIGVAAKDVTCPLHRAKCGKKWRGSTLCTYYNHYGKSNSDLRTFTLKEYHTLSERFPNQTIPFGLLISTKHRKQ